MNIVEQINDGIKAQLVAVLPASYKEMDYVLDVAKNNFRNNTDRFGVHPLDASDSPSVTNKITLKQTFEVILSDGYVNRDNDTAQREAIFALYDQMDNVLADLMTTKAGVPNIILLINEPSISAPEYPEDNIAVLRGQVQVQYRRST